MSFVVFNPSKQHVIMERTARTKIAHGLELFPFMPPVLQLWTKNRQPFHLKWVEEIYSDDSGLLDLPEALLPQDPDILTTEKTAEGEEVQLLDVSGLEAVVQGAKEGELIEFEAVVWCRFLPDADYEELKWLS